MDHHILITWLLSLLVFLPDTLMPPLDSTSVKYSLCGFFLFLLPFSYCLPSRYTNAPTGQPDCSILITWLLSLSLVFLPDTLMHPLDSTAIN